MPAYVIANIDVTDPDGYRVYAEQVGATIAAHGGRYLARGGSCETLEGEWGPRIVILEFADLHAARNWYRSPEYEAIKPLRHANSHGRVVITEGLPV
jgi:uncharacterized protein (DUF1330 family)